MKYSPHTHTFSPLVHTYTHTTTQRLLGWYREKFGEDEGGASILVPIGALRALRRLTAFSGGRCLCISGDKGHNSPEQFRGLMDPHIAVHGSFSVMVNYHAIGESSRIFALSLL